MRASRLLILLLILAALLVDLVALSAVAVCLADGGDPSRLARSRHLVTTLCVVTHALDASRPNLMLQECQPTGREASK